MAAQDALLRDTDSKVSELEEAVAHRTSGVDGLEKQVRVAQRVRDRVVRKKQEQGVRVVDLEASLDAMRAVLKMRYKTSGEASVAMTYEFSRRMKELKEAFEATLAGSRADVTHFEEETEVLAAWAAALRSEVYLCRGKLERL